MGSIAQSSISTSSRPLPALTGAMKEERIRLMKRALELRATGLTLRQISTRIGRSEGEVSKLVRKGRSANF